ncbi:hypothetical protein BDN67DRAFT_1017648 [Paxillus ammoniavirescens]|nr:hypothetical protein BDN67DRAFT_1017648 [Paxillus ammoniavirescens]
MSDNLFTMITEKPEIKEARKEFHAALEDLRAQALTALNKGMYEEQEMWCPVWQGKLNRLTTALRAEALKGMGLGMPPNNNKSFVEAHDTWKRWVAEAGARKQEAAEREAAEREATKREREHMEEEEAARAREMVDQMATDKPLGEEPERDEVEEEGTAMRPFVEAFDKGMKRVEEAEADNNEGERVDATAAWEEPRGQPRRVIGDHVRQGTDRCKACEERDHEACWGEDGWACHRCQSKRVACSMSIKAQRDREVSVTSGVSKSKTRAKGKGKARQVEPEWATSGPSRVPGSSRPWMHPGTISSVAAEVVGVDLLEADGQSTVNNNTVNNVVCNLSRLAAQGSFLEAQAQSIKARVMDLNVEVCDMQESQKKYFNQLEFVTTQMAILMRKAQEGPAEDSE